MQEIINVLGQYKTKGNEYTFKICPFCNNGEGKDTYKFSINKRKGTYQCFRGSCSAKGHITQLANKLNIRLSESYDQFRTTEIEYKKPSRSTVKADDSIYSYFSNRGISKAIVDYAQVKQTTKGWICYDFYDEQGNLTFRKFRSLKDKKILREEKTKPILFMMDKVDDESDSLIITEGEEDCLTLWECGYSNAVSLPAGAKDLNCLTHNWTWLQTFSTIIIWTDSDQPGREAMHEISKRIGEDKCKIVNSKFKDANECLIKGRAEYVIECIDKAKYLPISKVKTVNDYDVFELNNEHRTRSYFDFINNSMQGGYRKGEVIVWTGHRGCGKSTIIQQEITQFINQREKVCIYSAEMVNMRILKTFYKQCSGASNLIENKSQLYDGYSYSLQKSIVEKISNWCAEYLYLVDDDFDGVHKDLFSIFSKLVRQYGVNHFVIDNLMTILLGSKEIYTEQTEFVKASEAFAKKYNVIIHIIAHQRKNSEHNEKDFRPTIGGISGTANIGNLIDCCFGIARIPEKLKDESVMKENVFTYDAELSILKERETGKIGKFEPLFFEDKAKRFVNNWYNVDYTLGWQDEL